MVSIINLDANEYPIKSVIVFKSNKAEVVRIFKVSLEVSLSPAALERLNDRLMSYFSGGPE
jgi:hypothetical protein